MVNALYRTYEPVYPAGQGQFWSGPPLYYENVDECAGAPADNFDYAKDGMFSLYANMPIFIGGLGDYNGQIDPSQLPYTMEIDYVKFYRKIKCDKILALPPANMNPPGGYRSAGGIGCDASGGDQVPPIIDNQTPSVITGGTITVGSTDGMVPYIFRRDDFDYSTQQNLDLMATESVTLLPGFETDLLYQANGPCGPHSKSWTDNGVTYTLPYGNNWLIQDVFSANIVSCPMAKTESPPPPQPVIAKPVASVADFAVGLYPNPATSQCTVRFSIPDGADVTITLIDMMGRDIGTIDHSWHTQGTSFVPFSTEGYAPGVYTVRFTDGTHTSTQRLTISGRY